MSSDFLAEEVLAAYRDGVTVICELAAQFTDVMWLAATPCWEWRAADLAGHLRCVADDYHEYLDDAPASRLARLLAASRAYGRRLPPSWDLPHRAGAWRGGMPHLARAHRRAGQLRSVELAAARVRARSGLGLAVRALGS